MHYTSVQVVHARVAIYSLRTPMEGNTCGCASVPPLREDISKQDCLIGDMFESIILAN